MVAAPEEPFYVPDAMARSLIDEQFPHLAGEELGRRYTLEDQFAIRIGDHWGAIFPRHARDDALYERCSDLYASASRKWTFPASMPVATGTPGHGFPWHWVLVRWISASTAAFVPLHEHALAPFGRALRDLHSPASRKAPVNPRAGAGLAALRPWFEELLAFAVAKEAPENRVIDQHMVRAIFEAGAAERVDLAPTWTHGRLEPRAVMSDRGSFAGILLWHNLGAGDPAADLGYAANLVPLDGLDEFWSGYGPISGATASRAAAYQVFAALGYIYFDDPFLLRIAWERLIELEAAREA
ncbi:phosphotransferase [Demequina sp.]|uniref:phosphotransferase n=1 Tax=Demequina sp. TaxID=2050685 RepID=UPI003A870753